MVGGVWGNVVAFKPRRRLQAPRAASAPPTPPRQAAPNAGQAQNLAMPQPPVMAPLADGVGLLGDAQQQQQLRQALELLMVQQRALGVAIDALAAIFAGPVPAHAAPDPALVAPVPAIAAPIPVVAAPALAPQPAANMAPRRSQRVRRRPVRLGAGVPTRPRPRTRPFPRPFPWHLFG